MILLRKGHDQGNESQNNQKDLCVPHRSTSPTSLGHDRLDVTGDWTTGVFDSEADFGSQGAKRIQIHTWQAQRQRSGLHVQQLAPPLHRTCRLFKYTRLLLPKL